MEPMGSLEEDSEMLFEDRQGLRRVPQFAVDEIPQDRFVATFREHRGNFRQRDPNGGRRFRRQPDG